MIDLTVTRKNKVVLSDYDYKKDIENRLLLSQFTTLDYAVLEEILFSPIRTSVRKIAKSIDYQEDQVRPILQKLTKTGLITFEEEAVVVDKETRKYFETEMEKFDENFQPGMEFLQHLLKKVPIHILPHWYAIPRTSNNIFESLIEKYLLTPQIFQRYLLDLNFPDPTLTAIAQDILKSPNFELPAAEVQKKYRLSPLQFHEAILNLEFHFICTIVYRKEDNHWNKVLTLFHEWKEHLTFLKETTSPTISDTKKITKYRPNDFSFVDDMTALLIQAKKDPSFPIQKNGLSKFPPPAPDDLYLKKILLKIEQIGLAELQDGKLTLTSAGQEWVDLRSENRALYLYRHLQAPFHTYEKAVREFEKSIQRILHSGWVRYSDFLKGTYAPAKEGQAVVLRKAGKNWKYQRPTYSEEDQKFMRAVIFEHLFEAGVVAFGTLDGETCLMVTPFGQSLFG